MLTSTLYIDYGDRFAGGVLATTVGAIDNTTFGANPNIDGPRLFNAAGNAYAAATAVTMTAFNTFYGGSAATMRATMNALVQRFFEPYDITVVDLTAAIQNVNGFNAQGAANLNEISQTLGLNEGVAENNDGYMLVVGIAIGATNDDPTRFATRGYGGLATGTDIGGFNNNDGTALTLLRSDYNARFLGAQIAHEAGHLFGLEHVYRQNTGDPAPVLSNTTATGAQYDQLHQSDLMSYLGYTSQGGFNVFSRYPMMDGDGNTNANILAANPAANLTPYDQLTTDPNIGPSNINYVTGTGTNDIITIAKTGANSANVSIQAFADTGYATTIDAPGATGNTYSYSISLDRPLTIDTGGRNDRIVLDSDLGVTITLRGMHGTDELVVMGKNATSGTYVPGTNSASGLDNNPDSRGSIMVIGNTRINFQEFESRGSKVTVRDFNEFILRTPLGNDSLTVISPGTGRNQITGSSGGVSIIPLEFSNIANFVLDTGANDGGVGNDTINLNAILSATGLQNFTLNTGDGNDIDRFNINTNSIALPVAGGALSFNGGLGGVDTLVFTTALPNAVIYTPESFNTPDRGALTFAGASMLFTGLEFVRPVTPVISGLSLTANVINEGDTAMLFGAFADPGSLSSHTLTVDWGDGSVPTIVNLSVRARAFQIAHPYLDDNPTATPFDIYTITVTITDNDSLSNTANTTITVNNVAPVITAFHAGAPSDDKAKEGMPITAAGSFTDVGILDTHTAVIDWGDGSFSPALVTEAGGAGTFTATHTFQSGGIFNVRVLLTDDDTGQVISVDTVFITGAGVHIVNGKRVLQFVGTNQADNVIVDEPGSGKINVYAAFLPDQAHRRSFDRAGIDYVEVVLCAGDDTATVSGWVTVLSIVDGGEGNDRLTGGRGGIVLIGGDGNDSLAGSTQRSILIGGVGEDQLIGRADDDILIGGRTLYDSALDENKLANDAALIRLLQEWKTPDSAPQRKARIESGVDGVFLRLGETVFDDGGAKDRLTGSTGADWFWLFGGDEALDYHTNLDLLTVAPAPILPATAPGSGTARLRPSIRPTFVS